MTALLYRVGKSIFPTLAEAKKASMGFRKITTYYQTVDEPIADAEIKRREKRAEYFKKLREGAKP